MFQYTKIITTIGPSSAKKEVLEKFEKEGVSVIRKNLSHGTLKENESYVKLSRDYDFAIALDTAGPEVRFLTKDKNPIPVEKNKILRVYVKEKYPMLSMDVLDFLNEGDRVYFDDGLIEGIVENLGDFYVDILITNSGEIKNKARLNFPDSYLDLPLFTKEDLDNIKLLKKYSPDFLFLSFTQKKEDIYFAKEYLPDSEIIAKIETQKGVDNVEEIIKHADGIMIARGDLALEISPEKVPLFQKEVIRKARKKGKLTIVATQLLSSMVLSPRPTRAEVSDIANAILDGVDALMLSNETASGKYPVECVRFLKRIIEEISPKIEEFCSFDVVSLEEEEGIKISEYISRAVNVLARRKDTTKTVVLTKSGYSAKMISRFRQEDPIIALVDDEKVYRKLKPYFGIYPVLMDKLPEENIVEKATMFLIKKGVILPDDLVVFTAGVKTKNKHLSNYIEVHKIKDLLDWMNSSEV